MKDFFKKLSKPQPEVEDLDTGYDSIYYAGSYDKADRKSDDRRDGDRREGDRREGDRREGDRPADRFEERDYRSERADRFDRAERAERENDLYTPRTGLYEEEDAPAYRERVEEKVEPVFAPEPAPEYLYYTPATYRDCREGIVKGLAAGHVVVVRLGDLEASDVLRLFDYMMGAVLALDAELVRPEATTVVLVPDGVELDEDELELDDEDEYEDDEEYEDEEYDEDEAYEEYDEDGEYAEDSNEDAE